MLQLGLGRMISLKLLKLMLQLGSSWKSSIHNQWHACINNYCTVTHWPQQFNKFLNDRRRVAGLLLSVSLSIPLAFWLKGGSSVLLCHCTGQGMEGVLKYLSGVPLPFPILVVSDVGEDEVWEILCPLKAKKTRSSYAFMLHYWKFDKKFHELYTNLLHTFVAEVV